MKFLTQCRPELSLQSGRMKACASVCRTCFNKCDQAVDPDIYCFSTDFGVPSGNGNTAGDFYDFRGTDWLTREWWGNGVLYNSQTALPQSNTGNIVTTTVAPGGGGGGGGGGDGGGGGGGDPDPVFETGTDVVESMATCGGGVMSNTPGSRIVGGVTAVEGTHPWLVRLVVCEDIAGSNCFGCGGTIIDNKWILTAAHCLDMDPTTATVQQPAMIQVIGGEYDTTSFNMGSNDFAIQYDTINGDNMNDIVFIHPDWDSGTANSDDIALIKIASGLDIESANQGCSTCYGHACLPTGDVVDNDFCWVAGWGDTSSGGSSSTVLLEVGLNVFSHDYCLANTNYASLGTTIVDDKMFCAGTPDNDDNNLVDGGKDSCQGDSGGTLVCKDPSGNAVVFGVVSFGIQCAVEGLPGVYVDVFNYMSYINGVMAANP